MAKVTAWLVVNAGEHIRHTLCHWQPPAQVHRHLPAAHRPQAGWMRHFLEEGQAAGGADEGQVMGSGVGQRGRAKLRTRHKGGRTY